MMLVITYDEMDGIVVPDGKVHAFVDDVIAQQRDCVFTLTVGTETIINAVRLAVIQGKIGSSYVLFKYKDETLPINEYGVLPEWPHGFADFSIDVSRKIITLAMEKRKANAKKETE